MTRILITLTPEDRKILERVRRRHRQWQGHSAVVETQDVRDADEMRCCVGLSRHFTPAERLTGDGHPWAHEVRS